LIGGGLAGLGLSLLRIEILSIAAGCVMGAGVLISLFAAFLAFLGVLFPGKCSRLRFALLFLVSVLPFVLPSLLFMGIAPT
jgi:hypothetical protein